MGLGSQTTGCLWEDKSTGQIKVLGMSLAGLPSELDVSVTLEAWAGHSGKNSKRKECPWIWYQIYPNRRAITDNAYSALTKEWAVTIRTSLAVKGGRTDNMVHGTGSSTAQTPTPTEWHVYWQQSSTIKQSSAFREAAIIKPCWIYGPSKCSHSCSWVSPGNLQRRNMGSSGWKMAGL